MEKKTIQAKNVVSFNNGKGVAMPEVPKKEAAPVAEAVKASESAVREVAENLPKGIKEEAAEPVAEAAEEAAEAVPPMRRPAEEPEAIETRPLNLRKNRYLDETPQEEDWADEDYDDFDDEPIDDLSTFAEVFIPLHDDSAGAIVRKGLVIVSLIVILCCIVAIVLKQTGTGAVISPDISALAGRAVNTAAVALVSL